MSSLLYLDSSVKLYDEEHSYSTNELRLAFSWFWRDGSTWINESWSAWLLTSLSSLCSFLSSSELSLTLLIYQRETVREGSKQGGVVPRMGDKSAILLVSEKVDYLLAFIILFYINYFLQKLPALPSLLPNSPNLPNYSNLSIPPTCDSSICWSSLYNVCNFFSRAVTFSWIPRFRL